MRCINSEDVPAALSRLARRTPPSYLPLIPGHHDVPVTGGAVSDVPSPSGPLRAFPINGLNFRAMSDSSNSNSSVVTPSSSPSASPQLSPMSTRSDSVFPGGDSPVVTDLPDMSSPGPSRPVLPQRFQASASSPELNSILPENHHHHHHHHHHHVAGNTRRCPPGVIPSSSSVVNSLRTSYNGGGGGDSESSASSRTSTARNSPSRNASGRSSSSRNLPGEGYPRAISSLADLSVSETQLVGRTPRAKVSVRTLSEGPTDGLVSDLLKRYHHRSADPVLNKPAKIGEGDEGSEEQNKNLPAAVQLPERYRHVLKKSGSYANIGNVSSRKSSSSSNDQGQDLTSREKDLGTALAWIRNEMVQMKEQDKVLLKRFIELRATILQLRCSSYGSSTSLCSGSLDGSSASLNYDVRSGGIGSGSGYDPSRMRNAGSDAMLAGRLYAATSSLSLPCSPMLSRPKWDSDELM